jgi:hypothetical protein
MIARIFAWLVMIGSLAGVAAIIAAERIEALSIPAPVVPALLAIGAFAAVATVTVKARSGWAVIAVLPALLVPLGAIGATSHWVGDVGDRLVAPQAAEQVASPYHMAIGRMIVDLSHVDPKGGTVTVDARTAIGRLDVVLPATAAVSGHAHVRAGDIQVFGGAHRSGSGADLDIHDTPAAASPGTFVLNADAGFGAVRVCRAALAGAGTSGCS